MGEGRVKNVQAVALGRCVKCGTPHTNVGAGAFCYLCDGLLRPIGIGNVRVIEPAPCSKALINELYARRVAR